MEITKRVMLILISILLITGTATSKESEISDTLTASCLIKITSDPVILPLDDMTINYLLHSSGVGGKAAKEILDAQLSGEALEVALQIEWLADGGDMLSSGDLRNPSPEAETYEDTEHQLMMEMMVQEREAMEARMARPSPRRSSGRRTISEPLNITSEQMILLRIVVNLEEDNIGMAVEPAAEEFMNAAIDNLKTALTGAFDEYIQRLHGRLRLADMEVSRTEEQLSEMQERLRSIAGSRILDKDNILNNIMDLRRELQDTKMEQDSDKVIVEAITNRIAETQAKLKEQVVKDDITKELQQIIENQRQLLEDAKQIVEGGMSGREKLAQAEEKLARARIELAQRREQMSKSAGGDLIESLNRELANRSIKSAQNQARIETLSRQLAEAEEWLNKADDHEILSLKADITKQNLREAIVWRDRISRQDRLIQPPSVTVLGGE
jgi:hypothetical protein